MENSVLLHPPPFLKAVKKRMRLSTCIDMVPVSVDGTQPGWGSHVDVVVDLVHMAADLDHIYNFIYTCTCIIY